MQQRTWQEQSAESDHQGAAQLTVYPTDEQKRPSMVHYENAKTGEDAEKLRLISAIPITDVSGTSQAKEAVAVKEHIADYLKTMSLQELKTIKRCFIS